MTRTMRDWLSTRWRRRIDPGLADAYQVTFSTLHGRQVLRHLMDEVYCQLCPLNDPIALATHNGRRSLVHEMLENIDAAESPGKYETELEGVNHG